MNLPYDIQLRVLRERPQILSTLINEDANWSYYRTSDGQVDLAKVDHNLAALHHVRQVELEKENYIQSTLLTPDNKRYGPTTNRTRDGQVLDTMFFINDQLEGQKISYYEDGSLYEVSNWSEGQLNGTYERYYRNGQPAEQASYRNGKAVGQHLWFYRNGQVEKECNHNLNETECVSYDPDGSVIDNEIY